jgi:hypothetical protein
VKLKKKHAEVAEAVDGELAHYQSKYRAVTSELAERERLCEEHEVRQSVEGRR